MCSGGFPLQGRLYGTSQKIWVNIVVAFRSKTSNLRVCSHRGRQGSIIHVSSNSLIIFSGGTSKEFTRGSCGGFRRQHSFGGYFQKHDAIFSDGFDEGCLNIFGFKIACAELQEHFDRNCLFLFNLKMVRPFCGFQLEGSLRDVSIGKGLHSNLLFFRFQRQLTLYFKIIYMGVLFFRLQDGLYGSMWHSKRTNVTSSCGILLQDNLCGTSTDFRW